MARSQPVTGASGTPYQIPVTATRGQETVLVFASPVAAVPEEDLKAVADIVADVGASRAVVASPAQADASTPAGNVTVWTRDVIVREVGEAIVESVLEDEAAAPAPAPAPAPASAKSGMSMVGGDAAIITGPGNPRGPKRFQSILSKAAGASAGSGDTSYLYDSKPRSAKATPKDAQPLPYAWGASAAAVTSPTHRSVAELVPSKPRRQPAGPAPAAAAPATTVIPGAQQAPPKPRAPIATPEEEDFEIMESKPRAAQAEAVPAAAAEEKAAPAAPAAVPDGHHAAPPETIALKVDRARAERAANAGAVHDARLVLEPHIRFDYDAHVARDNLPTPLTGKGVILASALTGEVREGPVFEAAHHFPVPFDPPTAAKKQAADVYDKVKSTIRKKFSREMKAKRTVGESEVWETVRVSPDVDELGLDHKGIVNLPVWVLETDKGVVRVDGSTGDVIS